MNTKFWAKLRPTAVIFAVIMGVLVWVLTSNVLGGEMGALAFGDGQVGAILSATLIVIGTAIGGLSNALQKLSEDTPDPAPQQVSENVVLELLNTFSHLTQPNPGGGHEVVAESHTRAREGLGDG